MSMWFKATTIAVHHLGKKYVIAARLEPAVPVAAVLSTGAQISVGSQLWAGEVGKVNVAGALANRTGAWDAS